MIGRSSIRQRLKLFFVLMTISPLLLVGLLLSWQIFEIQKKAAFALQNEISKQVINEISSVSETLSNTLDGLVSISGLLGQDLTRQFELLGEIQALSFEQQKNVLKEVSLLDLTGQETMKVSQKIVFESSDLRNRAKDDLFSIPAKEKNNYYGTVIKDSISKESLMELSLPILNNRTGEVSAVLAVVVRLNHFWDVFVNEGISSQISVYITTENGTIVSHDDPSVSLAGLMITVPAHGEFVLGFDGLRSVRQTQMFSLGSQGFYLVCDYHVHDAFSGVYKSVAIVGFFILSFLVISLIAAYRTVNPIIAHIEDLGDVARAIFEGDLGKKAVIDGSDEVALLGTAMNTMTNRLIADIERRRQIEEKLKAEIAERIRMEKEHDDLQVRALAQNKLATLGEVATGVAHEINQPLSYIKIIFESTTRDLTEGVVDQKELLGECQESLRQIRRISTIIDHLRTFGRSDNLVVAETNLGDVWRDTKIIFGERVRQKNISLVEEFGEDISISGNGLKLEQLFINLLQNSLDSMVPMGGGILEIHIKKVEEMVEVVFSDTGAGITKDVQERMFEPFYTTKKVGQGTGLGLAISYGIVKEHNGTIDCESQSGQPTIFTIRFPFFTESLTGLGGAL